VIDTHRLDPGGVCRDEGAIRIARNRDRAAGGAVEQLADVAAYEAGPAKDRYIARDPHPPACRSPQGRRQDICVSCRVNREKAAKADLASDHASIAAGTLLPAIL
jgi:hypothetical protein